MFTKRFASVLNKQHEYHNFHAHHSYFSNLRKLTRIKIFYTRIWVIIIVIFPLSNQIVFRNFSFTSVVFVNNWSRRNVWRIETMITIVFSERPPRLVALYVKPGVLRTYSNPHWWRHLYVHEIFKLTVWFKTFIKHKNKFDFLYGDHIIMKKCGFKSFFLSKIMHS